MVSYLPYAMGRMKFIWGDDAEEYKPERWLDCDGFFRPDNPFKLTAFQVGQSSLLALIVICLALNVSLHLILPSAFIRSH